MAALILVGLALGAWVSQLPRGEFRSDVLFVHKSIGVTVFGLVLLRIVWRLLTGAPPYLEPLGRLTSAAAHSAHMALYLLMIALPLSGYVISTAGGNAVSWFGLFTLPSLLDKDRAIDHAARQAHEFFAWTIAVVLAAHLGAVVWHTAIKRDAVLTRMWPSYRPTRP
jgi:cytochrome b561